MNGRNPSPPEATRAAGRGWGGNLRKLWAALSPGLRARTWLLLPVLLVGSVVELLGISVIYPVVVLVVSRDWLDQLPGALDYARSLGLDPIAHPDAFRTTLLVSVGVLFVFRSVYLAWLEFWVPSLLGRIRIHLATSMMRSYLAARFRRASERTSSKMQQFIINQTFLLSFEYLRALADILTSTTLATGVLLGLILVNPFLVAAGGGTLLVLGALIWLTFGPISRRLGEATRRGSLRMLYEVGQAVGGIRETKLAQRGPFFLERFHAATESATVSTARQFGIGGAPSKLLETVLVVVGLLFAATRPMPDNRGELTAILGSVGVLIVALLRVVPFVLRILRGNTRRKYAETAVSTFLEELEELKSAEQAFEVVPRDQQIRMSESLSCRALEFAYEPSQPILRGLDLTIKKGEMVAFAGASGAGKSTLVDLLCGLLEPDTGDVGVDGRSIRGREHQWWPSTSYVQQVTFILEGTLAENVAFGVPPEEVDVERLHAVLDVVRLSEVVAPRSPGCAARGRRAGQPAIGRRAPAGGARPGAVPDRRGAAGFGRSHGESRPRDRKRDH